MARETGNGTCASSAYTDHDGKYRLHVINVEEDIKKNGFPSVLDKHEENVGNKFPDNRNPVTWSSEFYTELEEAQKYSKTVVEGIEEFDPSCNSDEELLDLLMELGPWIVCKKDGYKATCRVCKNKAVFHFTNDVGQMMEVYRRNHTSMSPKCRLAVEVWRKYIHQCKAFGVFRERKHRLRKSSYDQSKMKIVGTEKCKEPLRDTPPPRPKYRDQQTGGLPPKRPSTSSDDSDEPTSPPPKSGALAPVIARGPRRRAPSNPEDESVPAAASSSSESDPESNSDEAPSRPVLYGKPTCVREYDDEDYPTSPTGGNRRLQERASSRTAVFIGALILSAAAVLCRCLTKSKTTLIPRHE